ncbi:MAG: XdhC family protein [Acidobacteriota bacterium]|nr:XdhC family protein [Acidobacteriota bacterium]MDQ3373444.1 XdhC family protein [Acidobacteriota bacterium]
MKELQTILKESIRLKAENTKAVLATVVDVQGSSYRLPGAKMLISEAGETFGTVSGGCLEADVLEHARQVLQRGEPTVLTYDTTDTADSVFSLNMGCNGIVRILLESANDNDFFAFAEKCLQTGKRVVVANLICSSDERKLKTGLRFFFDESDIASNNPATEIEQKLFGDVKDVFASGNSQCRTYEIENERAEFFLEIISPLVSLVIFGAGYDAIPVAEFAKNLGWRVRVVDHRVAFAARERFPAVDEILILRPEDLPEKFDVGGNSVAVIMTHNYAFDRQILKFLLSKSLAYIGALGPKRRTESLLEELQTEGAIFTRNQLGKLYAPVGLDIGAAHPETIALSIIAEINSVLSNRAGGFLRARQGSIYDRQLK